jgi:tRNA-2-methylthio-N6-dimethylallyladenosine synthase
MNERDSEAVASQLIAHGYSMVDHESAADIVLFNTCSVRDSAEQKAIGKMRFVVKDNQKAAKKVYYGFLGCMAQAHGESLFKTTPGINLVMGTHKFHRVAEHLDELLSGKANQLCDIGEEPKGTIPIPTHMAPKPGETVGPTAFVNIMQGCNQHCTFCIVPTTRGQEQSRTIAEIVEECTALSRNGVRDITLLGQIVTSYGKRDIPIQNGRSPFVQLLEAVHAVDDLARIRFTAPHPKGYGDDLVEAYARLPKVCSSAHIPVQSGSNRILKLMHRGYTRETFIGIIEKLRQARPDIGVSTDIIVGFPGETEEDFEATMDLARIVEFDNAFLFKYSPRQGTPAADMPDALPLSVREERHTRLMKLVNDISARRYQAMVGQTVTTLVEGTSKRVSTRMQGRSSCNKIVVFDGTAELKGRLVEVLINKSGSFTLYGDMLTPAQPTAKINQPQHSTTI